MSKLPFIDFPTNNTDQHYLLAVSGGVDSMVLMDVFLQAKQNIEIAHVNYRLRGSDSDKDQFLVEEYCKKHHLKLHHKVVSEQEKEHKKNTQDWARQLRYQYFNSLLEEKKAVLVTAHHLNDELEGFIIHLSRASGLGGLSGMANSTENVWRPFLKKTKEEINHYAYEQLIPFREDKTNLQNDYLRNYIRNEIAPLLEKTSSHFYKNFNQSIAYLQQSRSYLQECLAKQLRDLQISEQEQDSFHKDRFLSQSDYFLWEVLQNYGFGKSVEIDKIKTTKTGSVFISPQFHMKILSDRIIMQPANILIQKREIKEIEIPYEDDELIIWRSQQAETKAHWQIDENLIKLPLSLQTKKEGDLFYPLGFDGSKKVSKYWKDQKISTIQRDKQLLLTDSNHNILGVLNRQDRRFVATEKTTNYLHVIWKKGIKQN